MEARETKVNMTPEEYNLYLHNQLFEQNEIPLNVPFKNTIGESVLGLMIPTLLIAINQTAIPPLNGYRMEGCPVNYGLDWTQEHLDLILEQ